MSVLSAESDETYEAFDTSAEVIDLTTSTESTPPPPPPPSSSQSPSPSSSSALSPSPSPSPLPSPSPPSSPILSPSPPPARLPYSWFDLDATPIDVAALERVNNMVFVAHNEELFDFIPRQLDFGGMFETYLCPAVKKIRSLLVQPQPVVGEPIHTTPAEPKMVLWKTVTKKASAQESKKKSAARKPVKRVAVERPRSPIRKYKAVPAARPHSPTQKSTPAAPRYMSERQALKAAMELSMRES